MNDIKVKFCGLRTIADLELSANLGVDAVGFVMVEKSPRFVTTEKTAELIQVAKELNLLTVVLFANNEKEFINNVINKCQPDILQFHGFESAAFCEQFNQSYWKAIPMLEQVDVDTYIKDHPKADAFLLDAFGHEQTGGSGEQFKWFKLQENWIDKVILAGGLDAENIAHAVAETGAQFLDISSGIEEIKGVKSNKKMTAFMENVKSIIY